MPPGLEELPEQVKWFQFHLDASELPSWFRSKCLQKCIAALEGLAQVVLLALRAAEAELVPGRLTLVLAQLCDNQGTASASCKMLSLKQLLDAVLQALAFFCSKYGVGLHITHIAGERNIWADQLSRGVVPAGFVHHGSLDIKMLLEEPWDAAT